MLTIFSIPKPFQSHIAIIQCNAIQSWTRLHPDREIILCGDEMGTQEAAVEIGARHLSNVKRNEFGTPLLDSVFERVEQIARYQLLCYVNADIILMRDFISAVKSIRLQKFLMVGQRWDINLAEPVDFKQDDWEARLRGHVGRNGSLQPPDGIDYFVFPRQTMGALLPFAVGRPGWDNWFIYRARALGIPVIDATRAVTVIHQNHDYAHVKESLNGTVEGPEAKINRSLIGGWEYIFTIRDATYTLRRSRSNSGYDRYGLRKRLVALPVPAAKAKNKITHEIKRGVKFLRRSLGLPKG